MPAARPALKNRDVFMVIVLSVRIESGFADVFQSLSHQLDDMIIIKGIKSFFAGFAEFDQSSCPQDPQLMRNGGLTHLQRFRDIADA